jgi:hypothetical protein
MLPQAIPFAPTLGTFCGYSCYLQKAFYFQKAFYSQKAFYLQKAGETPAPRGPHHGDLHHD